MNFSCTCCLGTLYSPSIPQQAFTNLFNVLDEYLLLMFKGVFPWQASAGVLPLLSGNRCSLNFGLVGCLWPQSLIFWKKYKFAACPVYLFTYGSEQCPLCWGILRGSQSQHLSLSLNSCYLCWHSGLVSFQLLSLCVFFRFTSLCFLVSLSVAFSWCDRSSLSLINITNHLSTRVEGGEAGRGSSGILLLVLGKEVVLY